MSTVCLLLLALSFPSLANDAAEAERVRLSEEMENLASRGQWVAVERKYQQILELKKVDLKFDDHMLGAQAAAGIGDLSLAYERLNLALQIEPKPEGIQWKTDIESSYGLVSIKTAKKSGPLTITPVKMPFIPEQQDAIQRASKLLSTNGNFEGLLPYGSYTAGATDFTIEPSSGAVTEPLVITANAGGAIASNEQPKEPRQPRESKGGFGPWVTIGGAFLQTGAAELESAAFDGQGGMTGQAGLGFQVKFRSSMRIGFELAYSGTRIRQDDGSMIDSELKHYHAWLPIGLNKKNWTYLFGPTYFVASTAISGEVISDANAATSAPQPVAFEGLSGGTGLQLGLQKPLFSIGQSLDGGLTLSSAIEYDGVRLYSWGQLAFTISPQFSEKG